MRSEQPILDRPQIAYRQDLINEICALSPQSILDVGCGDGALLERMAQSGCTQCIGIEVDHERVMKLRERGIHAQVGSAEALEFADRAFQVVIFEYVAHHLANLEGALIEAARVCERAVLVLEPWYDLSVASQRIARDFDLWLKRLDRKSGMVHEPCADAGKLVQPFNAIGEFRLEWRTHLVPLAIAVRTMEEMGRTRLDAVGGSRSMEDELEVLLDRARLDGFTEDGAMLFSAYRR